MIGMFLLCLLVLSAVGLPLLDLLGAAVKYRSARRQDRADLRRIGR